VTRRKYSRRPSRRTLRTRAPHRSTLIIASFFYIIGLFGILGFFSIPDPYDSYALAFAGGLLILGALLRDL
jgi:hypothetical protein